jgi:hypothetical protein
VVSDSTPENGISRLLRFAHDGAGLPAKSARAAHDHGRGAG